MLGIGKKKQTEKNTTAQTANGTPESTQPQVARGVERLKSGSVSLIDLLAPSSVEVDFKYIRVGDAFYRTFIVIDYPREVSPNWLSILIDYKETMNVSMFIYPVESKDILSNLKRKIGEMEATIESDMKNGIEPDPKVRASLEDAIALREELARGLERFFQFGLYVTLSAKTVDELDKKTNELTSLLASNLLVIKPATLQMEDGFKTTLPLGEDKLFITRNMDTTSVASTFPFTSYEISQPNGIFYGVNTLNNSLIIVDRFSFENANSVVFGKSGSGKSFLVKLEVLRQMMFDTEILIIDPEDEYKALCHGLDGEYISFSKDSEVKINPFALLSDDRTEAQLGIKFLALHSLLKIMLGEFSPTQEAILDRALVLCYKQKGIIPDPSTFGNEPPILEDLYKTLLNMEEADAKDLAFRLEKYIKGGFAGLLNSQTNYDVKNQLTVFSIKQLEESLRPVAMQVILDFIWNRVRTKLKKRILIVDEAWYLMKNPDSAAFLQGIAKRARKYYLGVTTLTQDIEDFLSSDYGKAILSNSSMQILLKQNSSEVETLASTLNLSEGEKQFLLTAQVGEGLFFAGQNHLTAQFLASNFEYQLVTSKPQDILDEEQRTNPGAAEQFINQSDKQAAQAETEAAAPGVPVQPVAVPSTPEPTPAPAVAPVPQPAPPTVEAAPVVPAVPQNPQTNIPTAQAETMQTKINNG
ncbi:MAG: ATP-binding protein [Candidatus Levybacteria bacterium]|nr:ATP-binding protein [Candidatus Levybacteria bacterium]MBP9814712.1 ATP-binding protein [Candidatus Levybacteria bacterium]